MQTQLVDPRDVTSEIDSPAYRVRIWKRSAIGGAPSYANVGYECSEYSITDTDVRDVLDWAENQSGADAAYSVYVAVALQRGLTLVRLAGADPV